MAFDLRRPCVDCPFLQPRAFPLDGRRAAEIAAAVEHQTFACHKTTGLKQPRDQRGRFGSPPPQQHCAGVLQIMRNTGEWGDMQQIAMRLGLFDPDALGHDPVYATLEDFVRAMGGTPIPWRPYRAQRH